MFPPFHVLRFRYMAHEQPKPGQHGRIPAAENLNPPNAKKIIAPTIQAVKFFRRHVPSKAMIVNAAQDISKNFGVR